MKAVLWIVAALVLVVVGVGIDRAGEHELPPPGDRSQIVFSGGSASGRRITMKSWSANYKRIVSNADQSMLEVDGVSNAVIDQKGRPFLRVDARHVSINMTSHDMQITGPLHAETIGRVPARSFDTQAANWNDGQQLLTLPTRVVVRTQGSGPLVFSSGTLNVKTGDFVVNDVAGTFR